MRFLLGLLFLMSFSATAGVAESKQIIKQMCNDKAARESTWWTSEDEIYNVCMNNAKIDFYRRSQKVLKETNIVIAQVIKRTGGSVRADYQHRLQVNQKQIQELDGDIQAAPSWMKGGRYGSSNIKETRKVVEVYLTFVLELYVRLNNDLAKARTSLKKL